jgi:hypothetical protein
MAIISGADDPHPPGTACCARHLVRRSEHMVNFVAESAFPAENPTIAPEERL